MTEMAPSWGHKQNCPGWYSPIPLWMCKCPNIKVKELMDRTEGSGELDPEAESPKQDRYGMPEFYALLQRAAGIHHRKSHDYASRENPAGNYHFAGLLASMFSHSVEDAGFIGRIGEKIYRLANLESSKKTPQNESIEDTEDDIFVITGLWMADRRKRRNDLRRQEVQSYYGDAGKTEIRKAVNEVACDVPRKVNRIDNDYAQVKMIELVESLNPEGKLEMIRYLQNTLRHDDAKKLADTQRRTTEHTKDRQ